MDNLTNLTNIMTTARFSLKLRHLAALAFVAGVTSTGVSANTVTMDNYNGAGNTVTCDPLCYGFVISATNPSRVIDLSNTNADKLDQNGSSDATAELALLNQLLADFDPARASVSHVNKTDGDGNGFSTSLQYFSIKKSTELWYFENKTGGAITVNLEGRTEDYSHWTEYGAVSAVPVPAAFWLFGTALIGFIGLSRRTRV